jgi:hypothetical protein
MEDKLLCKFPQLRRFLPLIYLLSLYIGIFTEHLLLSAIILFTIPVFVLEDSVVNKPLYKCLDPKYLRMTLLSCLSILAVAFMRFRFFDIAPIEIFNTLAIIGVLFFFIIIFEIIAKISEVFFNQRDYLVVLFVFIVLPSINLLFSLSVENNRFHFVWMGIVFYYVFSFLDAKANKITLFELARCRLFLMGSYDQKYTFRFKSFCIVLIIISLVN